MGHLKTMQILIRHHKMQHLIRVCTVCLKYRKVRVEENSLKALFRTIFLTYTQEAFVTRVGSFSEGSCKKAKAGGLQKSFI